MALTGPKAEAAADVVALYGWLNPVGAELPVFLSVWPGSKIHW